MEFQFYRGKKREKKNEESILLCLDSNKNGARGVGGMKKTILTWLEESSEGEWEFTREIFIRFKGESFPRFFQHRFFLSLHVQNNLTIWVLLLPKGFSFLFFFLLRSFFMDTTSLWNFNNSLISKVCLEEHCILYFSYDALWSKIMYCSDHVYLNLTDYPCN